MRAVCELKRQSVFAWSQRDFALGLTFAIMDVLVVSRYRHALIDGWNIDGQMMVTSTVLELSGGMDFHAFDPELYFERFAGRNGRAILEIHKEHFGVLWKFHFHDRAQGLGFFGV